jgi:tripartite-type tricarboxylate transporter receptor subunit TctC
MLIKAQKYCHCLSKPRLLGFSLSHFIARYVFPDIANSALQSYDTNTFTRSISMLLKKITWLAAAASLATFGLTSAYASEDYPSKDRVVTIVVPFAAGGPTDRVARDLAEALRKPLGATSVVVENAAGGPGGLIGANKVAKANPDGYTLLLHHISMGVFPTLVRNLPFKVETDFEYLGMINEVPMTLIGKPQIPANNFKELSSWISANKDKVNIANAGISSASHLCGLLFQAAIKADMTTVPYKGTGPAMTDLIGGQTDLMCDQTTNTSQQIEGKKVKVFGVTTAKRLSTPALKDIPTLQESGLKDFQVTIWHGLYAPKGTPEMVLKKINDALKTSLKDSDFVKKQEGLGAVIINDARVNRAEHKQYVASEIAKWAPIIKAANQYAD